MAYRLGALRVRDPELGALELIGDGFAAAGEPVTLVVHPTVQSWLGMSAEETRQALQIADEYRRTVSDAYATGDWLPPHRHPRVRKAQAEAEGRIARLLGPSRTQRLKRVSWRVRKADALLDDDVAEALGLSDAQRQALLAVMDENEAAKAKLFEDLRPARLQSQADLQERGLRYEDAGAERLIAVLTPRQRKDFEELHGEATPK